MLISRHDMQELNNEFAEAVTKSASGTYHSLVKAVDYLAAVLGKDLPRSSAVDVVVMQQLSESAVSLARAVVFSTYGRESVRRRRGGRIIDFTNNRTYSDYADAELGLGVQRLRINKCLLLGRQVSPHDSPVVLGFFDSDGNIRAPYDEDIQLCIPYHCEGTISKYSGCKSIDDIVDRLGRQILHDAGGSNEHFVWRLRELLR